MNSDQINQIFFYVWIALGVIGSAIFYLSKDAVFKRKLLPPFTIGIGILLVGYAALMSGEAAFAVLVIMVPFVGLIILAGIRNTKFCDACGKTNTSQNPFEPPEYCSKCGAKLQ